MKLSGWQRVGVVLSVLWSLSVAGFAAYEFFVSAPFDEFQFVEFIPDKNRAPVTETNPFLKYAPDTNGARVTESVTRQPVKSVLNIRAVLLTVVTPILFSWFLIYVALWVSRWVKNGFRA